MIPVQFTLIETLGPNFDVTSTSPGQPDVSVSGKVLTWKGTLTDVTPMTLHITAKRNGSDPVNVTTEDVAALSSLTVAVGGNQVSQPLDTTPLKVDVLPLGGTSLKTQTCSGACTTAGIDQSGAEFTLTTGTPTQTTNVFLTSFAGSEQDQTPADACQGFVQKESSVQFDIRPLSTDAAFEIVIPKENLGSTKWWQTKVCFGTNMNFITAIDSLANLRPASTGPPAYSRYWGLLPSIPRLVKVNGKWVIGPWISSRSQTSDGDAVIRIKVPFIPGSETVSTDGNPGFDPKLAWG